MEVIGGDTIPRADQLSSTSSYLLAEWESRDESGCSFKQIALYPVPIHWIEELSLVDNENDNKRPWKLLYSTRFKGHIQAVAAWLPHFSVLLAVTLLFTVAGLPWRIRQVTWSTRSLYSSLSLGFSRGSILTFSAIWWQDQKRFLDVTSPYIPTVDKWSTKAFAN